MRLVTINEYIVRVRAEVDVPTEGDFGAIRQATSKADTQTDAAIRSIPGLEHSRLVGSYMGV